MVNVLVIGSGGREHALAWKIVQSPLCESLYVAPGNGGTAAIATNVLMNISSAEDVKAFCDKKEIELVVIGPEAPLVAGLADKLEALGVTVFGCSKAAAQLEGSKAFTKGVCDRFNIPTATYQSFTDATEATAYVEALGSPCVVKADGLAAGKGVILCENTQDAKAAIDQIMRDKTFSEAGNRVVIEEWLHGEELSFFAICDGETAISLGSVQDHKRVGEGDTGLNTGGMGTYAPAPLATPDLEKTIMQDFIQPTLDGLKSEGIPFKGVLFAGIMMTDQGAKLLEYNVRFGDPETQVLMMRLESDLLPVLLAAAKGELAGHNAQINQQAALCVVMAAKGYPESYDKGSVIMGLQALDEREHVTVFHAGTRLNDAGSYVANGGRVLGITALGNTVADAKSHAYEAVENIEWPEGFCRNDIGWRAVDKAV